MNDSDLRQLADAAAQLLRPHLDRSEELRRVAALIGQWLCEQAGRTATDIETQNSSIASAPGAAIAAPAAPVMPEPQVPELDRNVEEPAAPPALSPAPLPLSYERVPLKLGDAVSHLPVAGTVEELGRARQAAVEPKTPLAWAGGGFAERPEADLALVERRCRLKAASCRLFIEKRAAGSDDVAEFEVRQRLNQMIAQAKAMPDCFLWVFWRERTQPEDAALSQIGVVYEALADAAALMRRIDGFGGEMRSDDQADAFQLLAEADSALRVALAGTWLTEDDHDQAEVHRWLRRETVLRGIFIGRHMTANDPADPSTAADLRERISRSSRRLDEHAGRAKEVKSALSQIRYHAGQVVKNGADNSSGNWAKIAEGVARLGGMGIAPSDRRIAEAVGSAAAALCPVEAMASRGLAVVIARAAALAVATDADADDEPPSEGREWSGMVLEVRERLRGKRMVVIGGEPNRDAVDRFVQAFELTDAEWVSLTEHGPGSPMRAPIFRPDTAVVIVIVKLTGHLHADEARAFAAAAGKPCILLSGGYNPERVAKAILDQASSRLKA